MFTEPLDALLTFMITTPVLGWALGKKTHRKALGIYAATGLCVTTCFLYVLYEKVAQEGLVLVVGQLPPNSSLAACFVIDILGIFMAFICTISGLLVTIYSIKYMEHDTGLIQYYTLLLGLIAGMIGITFAGDFFTMFVFLEFMGLASYALVAFRKERWEPIEASFKYLIMSAAGSATILLAMSFLYGMTGTLNFAGLAVSLQAVGPNRWLYVTLTLVIVGFGVKTAMAPFHTWLPDAHPAAPSPVSAMLSGVVIETGVYAFCRVLFLLFSPVQFQWGMILAVSSIVTMTLGNVMALLQRDIKRLLAYSSIAHIGYILVGIAAGTQSGLTGSVFHIFNHAFMKGLAFLCAGAFIYRAKTRNLDELSGIGRDMPISTLTLSIAVFALAGMPGLSGFTSKFVLFTAAIPAGMTWLAIAGIFNSAFSVSYYLRLILTLIRSQSSEKLTMGKEAPKAMLLPMCAMSVIVVLFGVSPEPVLALAKRAAASLIDLNAYISGIG